jgi:hypothetical protein
VGWEFIDAACRLGRQVLEHVFQIPVRIVAVDPGRLDQTFTAKSLLGEVNVEDLEVQERRIYNWHAIRPNTDQPTQGRHENSREALMSRKHLPNLSIVLVRRRVVQSSQQAFALKIE